MKERPIFASAALRFLTLAATLVLIGCPPKPPKVEEPDLKSPSTCPLVTVSVSSDIPFDTIVNDQASINCFAWQEFIGLNWPAAVSGAGQPAPVPASDFGKAESTGAVVWETYMNSHQLMQPDGSKPPPWGTTQPIPPACQELGGDEIRRVLNHTSKFTSKFEAPDDLEEAAPTNAPNWLADRHGSPVFFEILVSEDEYTYTIDDQRRLYNADGQVAYVRGGNHIDLPRGELGVRLGSIELKAAWLQVYDLGNEKWKRYKLSQAYATDHTGHCEKITVALVGLHIIHKTESNPQWIWATFEHEDNAPTQAEVDSGEVGDHYTFFNPDCQPQPIDPSCLDQQTEGCYPITEDAWLNAGLPYPDATSCTPNQAPSYCLVLDNPVCPPYPVQVTRVVPLSNEGDNLVVDLNREMKEIIREQAGEDSVWQYYQLIGTIWSGAPVDDNALDAKPPQIPLAQASLRPVIEALPIANTTMETYAQMGSIAGDDCNEDGSGVCTAIRKQATTDTCQTCHPFAAIADAGKTLPDGYTVPSYATDYSFVFQSAHSSTNPDNEGE